MEKLSTSKNSMYAIVSDSGSDLPQGFYDKHGVTLVPFHVRLGQDDLLDLPNNMPEDFYVRFSSQRERVRTSQPSVAEYEEVYQKLIDEGYTEIISLHISSVLSGSYQSAMSAAAKFEDQDVNIQVIDTKLASAAQGFMVADLVAMRDDGVSFEDAISHAKCLIPTIRLYFIPTQKNALGDKKKFERGFMGRMHKLRDNIFGTRFLEQIDEEGCLKTVTDANDLSSASARLARIMSRDFQFLGTLSYVEIHAGTPHALSFLEKPLDTNEFSSQRGGIIECSPSISCYTGAGSIGIAYVPEESLYNSDFAGRQVWEEN